MNYSSGNNTLNLGRYGAFLEDVLLVVGKGYNEVSIQFELSLMISELKWSSFRFIMA